MDKFPEAFKRFEKSEVDTSEIKSYGKLKQQFRAWSNRKTLTKKQDSALRQVAKQKGIKIPLRYKSFKRKGKTYIFGRDIKGRFVRKY